MLIASRSTIGQRSPPCSQEAFYRLLTTTTTGFIFCLFQPNTAQHCSAQSIAFILPMCLPHQHLESCGLCDFVASKRSGTFSIFKYITWIINNMGSIKHVLLALRKTRLIIKACQDGEMDDMASIAVYQKKVSKSVIPFFFVKSNCYSCHVSTVSTCIHHLILALHLPSLAAQCCAMTRWTRWHDSQMSRILRGEELIVARRDHVHAAVLRTHWHQRNPQPESM